MRSLVVATVLCSALLARAQDVVVSAPESPVTTETPVAASPPGPSAEEVALEAAVDALHEDLATLTGLERAARLLEFAGEHHGTPSALLATAEAKDLVREGLAAKSDARLIDAAAAVFVEADPKVRSARVQALGALADARAVPAIAYVARQDREVTVRREAAVALGSFIGPATEAAVLEIARDEQEELSVRTAAVASLGRQRSASAGNALAGLLQDREQSSDVRQAASDAIVEYFPLLAAELKLGAGKVAASAGRWQSTVVGAATGAYTLALVGSLSPNEGIGTVVGTFGGLVIGGATANLLARSYDVDEGDALLLGSAGIWSVPVGWFLGSLTGGPTAECNRACNAVALGTHVAAMGTTWLLRDKLTLTALDNLEINAAALTGLFLSLGAVGVPQATDDQRPGFVALAVGPTVGFVAGALFADHLQLSKPMLGLTTFAALEGLYALPVLTMGLQPELEPGPLGALIRNPDRDRLVAASAWLGVGVGLGGMLAASAFWQPTASDALLVGFSTVDGNLLGMGLPLLFGGESAWRTGQIASALGGVATGVAGGVLTRKLSLRMHQGDATLALLGTAFAGWQGAWGIWADQRYNLGNGRSMGLTTTIAGLGSLGALAATQLVDLSAWEAGWLWSGAVWGGWLAGWTAYVLDASGNGTLGAALVGSDIGLVAGALLLSPLVGLDPSRLAWVSVFGVGGMTVASMVAVFVAWSSPGKPVATANVIGTTAGLAIGAVVSGFLVDGSGGDAPPTMFGDVPLPLIGLAPVTQPGGTRVEGMAAQLAWQLE